MKNIVRDKEECYRIKEIIHQEEITIINVCTPYIKAPSYMKQLLTDVRGEIDANAIIVRDLNAPLTSTDRPMRQKLSKAATDLTETIEQRHLIVPSHGTEYTFSCTWSLLQNQP